MDMALIVAEAVRCGRLANPNTAERALVALYNHYRHVLSAGETVLAVEGEEFSDTDTDLCRAVSYNQALDDLELATQDFRRAQDEAKTGDSYCG